VDSLRAPAVVPAILLFAVCSGLPRLVPVGEALWVALVVLGLWLRGRGSQWLALVAASALWVEATWLRPVREADGMEAQRPVRAQVERVEPWRRLDHGWWTKIRLRSLVQGEAHSRAPIELGLTLGAGSPPPARELEVRGYLEAPRVFHNGPPRVSGGWKIRVKNRRFVSAGEADERERPGEPTSPEPTPSPGRDLARALVEGRRDALSVELRQALRRTGLAHLFAVSGLHVGAVAWLALRVPLPAPWLRTAVPVVMAGLYTLAVGAPVSAVRAWAMLCLLLLGPRLRRPGNGLNSLSVVAFLMMVEDPQVAGEIGFRLTVLATAGILVVLRLREGGEPSPLWGAVRVSVAASLTTLVVVAPAFAFVSPMGVLLNLPALPWVTAALAACLLWLGLGVLLPVAAPVGLALLDVLARPLDWLLLLPAHPLVSLPLSLAPWAAASLAAGLALAVRRRSLALALTTGLLLWFSQRGEDATDLGLTMVDVGQGDAFLLHDGRGAMLVDGGGWRGGDFGGRVLVPALASLGVRRIERLVVTHGDLDHCAGAADIALYLPVDEIWVGPGWGRDRCMARLSRVGRATRVVWRGDRLRWRRWRLSVLHPGAGQRGRPNERSLVLLAEAGGRRVLLTGDIGRVSESVVAAALRRPVDVLKVGHHGSRYSTGRVLLDRAAPSWALVSVSRDNSYGHPASRVLTDLRRSGAWVLRTDRHGQVRLRWSAGLPVAVEHDGPGLAPGSRSLVQPGRAGLLH
jgi:competence protein ComEC